ncbi:hypothetical protein [Kaistella pullorum]|uniref:Uncharacterized protein n=1 Tax=Kaistella pullorum TaxID=2763074 RepID=A0ABR8WP66_9FLAO|nr:hypothetical protein [Kaistella pullorum]MBD8018884.1 hypothetical protein [Kaistella pullorum]
MANIKKNGNLSGAIGNIVFVNDGDRVFARAITNRVKQSQRTKDSSRTFGLVSNREKIFRLRLLHEMGIPALQYFAARHRARIRKTLTAQSSGTSTDNPTFSNPQALAGFSFNPKTEWQSCTNFFPEFVIQSVSEMKVILPEIKWKEQIMPPKNSTSGRLTLLALTVDLNSTSVPLNIMSRLELDISEGSSAPGQEWTFPAGLSAGWLLIAACLKFKSKNELDATQQFAATYLWAGLTG